MLNTLLTPFNRLVLKCGLLTVTLTPQVSWSKDLSHSPTHPLIKREIHLEWEPITDATKYQIRIQSLSTQKIEIHLSSQPEWKGNLTPGLYTMELRSFDDRNVPGEWSSPNEFTVQNPQPLLISPGVDENRESSSEEKQNLEFKWEDIEGASNYHIVIQSIEEGTGIPPIEIHQTSTHSPLQVDLPVGHLYQWNVEIESDPKLPLSSEKNFRRFVLMGPQLHPPEISSPLSPYVQSLSWKPVPYCTSYDLVLMYKKGKKWQQVQKWNQIKKTEIPFDLSQPSGTYQIRVQAQAPYRKPSVLGKLNFNVRGGISNSQALEVIKLKDSMENKKPYYLIASYLITQISYQGIDHESNSGAQFQVLGGTGRIGIGYHAPQKSWGLFGIVDLSGFDLDSNRYTFAASELHGTWQSYWGKNQWRLGTGPFFKELPDLRGNDQNGFSGLGKIKSYGWHGGGQMWRPLSERLGVLGQVRVYYTGTGQATQGQQVLSSWSYQMGILGSYRLSSQTMGFAGYLFRRDQTYYKANPFSTSHPDSFAEEGDVNSVILEGHYLNLVLEYSF